MINKVKTFLLCCAICLCLPMSALGVINIYVDTGATGAANGDSWTDAYTSLSAAEAENLNLVTLTDSCVIHCRASTGVADTTAVDILGWTTSTTYRLTIQTDTADRHTGVWNANKYRLSVSSGHAINQITDYVNYVGLQISITGDVDYACIFVGGDVSHQTVHGYIDSCILKTEQANGNGINLSTYGDTATAVNTIIYKTATSNGGAEGVVGTTGGTVTLYQCVISGYADGVEQDSGTISCYNCVVFNSADDFDGVSGTISYCASDDVDGTNAFNISPGATETTDWASAFTDYANGDFSIKNANSVLYNAGTSLSASIDPDVDIKATARPQSTAWDIGAFECISATAPRRIMIIQ